MALPRPNKCSPRSIRQAPAKWWNRNEPWLASVRPKSLCSLWVRVRCLKHLSDVQQKLAWGGDQCKSFGGYWSHNQPHPQCNLRWIEGAPKPETLLRFPTDRRWTSCGRRWLHYNEVEIRVNRWRHRSLGSPRIKSRDDYRIAIPEAIPVLLGLSLWQLVDRTARRVDCPFALRTIDILLVPTGSDPVCGWPTRTSIIPRATRYKLSSYRGRLATQPIPDRHRGERSRVRWWPRRLGRSIYKWKRGVTWTKTSRRFWS